MHEHGLMTKLIATAQTKALESGGKLRRLKVRLGAMSTSTPEHFHADFIHVRDELGLGDLELSVDAAPDRPTGVELISIEIAE
jgi:Zn finger protein HypA/HybF involved in hydrogenase expression